VLLVATYLVALVTIPVYFPLFRPVRGAPGEPGSSGRRAEGNRFRRIPGGCGGSGAKIGSGSGGRATSAPASPSASPSAPAGVTGAKPLARLADVPVGGAVSATGPDGGPVIVAQPTAGQVVAFSAICTHKACTVAPAGKQLHCPCHGSVYDAATGKNLSGPAPRPLRPVSVRVAGGEFVGGA